MWTDKIILINLILLSIAYSLVGSIWIYWLIIVFDINGNFLTAIIVYNISILSIIFRFIPGNLGLNEIIMGGLFLSLNSEFGQGIIIGLFVRLSTLLIAFTIGIFATYHNSMYFNTRSFKGVINQLKLLIKN